jgi:hypothetical protein
MYSKKERQRIFEQVKKKIESCDYIFFLDSAIAYTPIATKTFYDWFPVDSDERKELDALLEANKLKKKDDIRRKLAEGDKAAELLALYRMICTDEERKAIATNYNKTDVTSNGKSIVVKVDKETADIIEGLKED